MAAVAISALVVLMGAWDERRGRAPFVLLAALAWGVVGMFVANAIVSDLDLSRRFSYGGYFDLEDLIASLEPLWPTVALLAAPAALMALLMGRLPALQLSPRAAARWARVRPVVEWVTAALLPAAVAGIVAAAPFYTAPPLVRALAFGDSYEALRLMEPQVGVLVTAALGAVGGLLSIWVSGLTTPRLRVGVATLVGALAGAGMGALLINWIAPLAGWL